MLRIDDTVWRLENPEEWHPGIVLGCLPFAVRAVFCSGNEPNKRHRGLAIALDCTPLTKPTWVHFWKVEVIDLGKISREPLGVLGSDKINVVLEKYQELKRAELL